MNNNIIVAVLVVVVIVLAALFAYREGFFLGSQRETDQPEIQINLPGGDSTPKPTSAGGY